MIWLLVAVFLAICITIALVRVLLGPTVPDRIVGLDTVNTIVVVSMVILGAAFEEVLLIDVGIVYALLSFVTTLFIAKYIEKGSF
ncbi:MAG: monovalent cation/H+ antiporter complex subunit F [Thermodesulfobacteriota bacterium]|nr:monovalent cation/H+ antiporter complex subunit F [Thermodesulfobacteriota bacterium]